MHCQRRTFNAICHTAKAIKLNFVDNEFFRGKRFLNLLRLYKMRL